MRLMTVVAPTDSRNPGTLHWPDEAACAAFAQRLAGRPARDVATPSSSCTAPLGAGKTTFVRHLLRALGVQGRIKSPTYAVMEPYAVPARWRSRTSISTASTTRANGPTPAFAIVFAQPGLKLAEWPEKAEGMLPPPDLRLHLEPLDEDLRRVQAEAFTARGAALLGG